MRSRFIQFLTRLSVFTLVLGLITLLIFSQLPAGYASITLPFQFVLFFSVILTVHYLLLKVSEKSPGSFITRFMLVSFLKLLFYITILVVYLLLNKNDILRFTIPYLILYILYSSFEIYSFIHFSKKPNPNHKEIKP